MPRQRAGDLRHRIVIQTATESVDSYGEVSRSWATYATRWGSMRAAGHTEQERSRQIEDRATHWVVMRYVSGVTPAMRLSFGGRYFNIVSVDNVEERERKTMIRCVEVVA